MSCEPDLEERYLLLHGDRQEARREAARLASIGRETVVVSACLVGIRCRFDGADKACPEAVKSFAAHAEILPLCPEVLARLGVPRPTMNLSLDGNQVFNANGQDVTQLLLLGVDSADELAQLAELESATSARLVGQNTGSSGVAARDCG